jgi:site-specific DNA recombinase
MGQMVSHGHLIYGYRYVKKTPTSPPALAINEEEAAVVRSMFELYGSGNYRLAAIARSLEERGILTRLGKQLWDKNHIKKMLQNTTYAGVRYFNTVKREQDVDAHGRRERVRKIVRDRPEWIAISVPPIVSQELFDKVQELLQKTGRRYRRPETHYLLQSLVHCGVCGSPFSSYRHYVKVPRANGQTAVYERAAYQCNSKVKARMHHENQVKHCHNSTVGTHILEGKVFDIIRQIILNPHKLTERVGDRAKMDDRRTKRLAQLAQELDAIEDERLAIAREFAANRVMGHPAWRRRWLPFVRR